MRFEKGPGAWETLNAEAMKGTEERTEATLNVLLRRGEALRERIALCESQSGVLSLCLSLFFFLLLRTPKKRKDCCELEHSESSAQVRGEGRRGRVGTSFFRRLFLKPCASHSRYIYQWVKR